MYVRNVKIFCHSIHKTIKYVKRTLVLLFVFMFIRKMTAAVGSRTLGSKNAGENMDLCNEVYHPFESIL